MKKILFMIHDLGQGGAEKVLVNLVNNMDRNKFDITVIALFGGGVNEQFLATDIHFRVIFPKAFPGNSQVMKFWTPRQLHRMFVKEEYDIEVSYLEGPTARIISGCDNPTTMLVTWFHSVITSQKELAYAFRDIKEMEACYGKYHKIVCVSQYMKEQICKLIPIRDKCDVLYNTVESEKILKLSEEKADELIPNGMMRLIAIGTLKEVKGFERLLRVVKRLYEEKYLFELYILGQGPLRKKLEEYISVNGLEKVVSLLGYQVNPYKFVAKSDLYVCSSYSEGFSTAVTEALIIGIPICTVEVSGMKEMLGDNNEYGIVTENTEEALYRSLKQLLEDQGMLKYYKQQAKERGKKFNTKESVKAVEKMFCALIERN